MCQNCTDTVARYNVTGDERGEIPQDAMDVCHVIALAEDAARTADGAIESLSDYDRECVSRSIAIRIAHMRKYRPDPMETIMSLLRDAGLGDKVEMINATGMAPDEVRRAVENLGTGHRNFGQADENDGPAPMTGQYL